MIKGIHHTSYYISDMDSAIYFYSEILGFKYSHKISNEKGEPWIVFLKIKEGQFLELFYGRGRKSTKESDAGYSHLCFEVDNIYELMSNLNNKNITTEAEIKNAKDGSLYFFVKDPEVNRIEFKQF